MQEFQAVVLAAGKGTRMSAQDAPKVLMPLAGKPMVAYLLDSLKALPDLGSAVIVVGFQGGLVKKALGGTYIYVIQEEQNGTAHALLAAKDEITAKNLLVLHGDTPYVKSATLKKIMDLHQKTASIISMAVCKVPNFQDKYRMFKDFGRIVRNENGRISKIVESNEANDEEIKILELNPAIYLFDTAWLWKNIELIEAKNSKQEFYLTDIVEKAISEGEKISSLEIDPFEGLGINSPEDLKLAESLI